MLFVANKKKRISSLLLPIGESLMGGGGKGPNQKRHFRGAGDRIGEFGRGKAGGWHFCFRPIRKEIVS